MGVKAMKLSEPSPPPFLIFIFHFVIFFPTALILLIPNNRDQKIYFRPTKKKEIVQNDMMRWKGGQRVKGEVWEGKS
jgi:hypothetical protein